MTQKHDDGAKVPTYRIARTKSGRALIAGTAAVGQGFGRCGTVRERRGGPVIHHTATVGLSMYEPALEAAVRWIEQQP